MRDNCLRLQIDTQELGDDSAEVLKVFNRLGWMLFSESVMSEEDLVDLPDIKPEFDEKSPSKRLRDRLFVYYKDTHSDINNFDEWYKKELLRIGQHYLDKMEG